MLVDADPAKKVPVPLSPHSPLFSTQGGTYSKPGTSSRGIDYTFQMSGGTEVTLHQQGRENAAEATCEEEEP